MTYRRLRRDELEDLERAFVRFLAAQGIPADDWTRIKVADVPRADELVDQFSQMVFDDVLTRCAYVEQRGRHQLLVYRTGPDLLEVRGLLAAPESGIDFRQNSPPAELLAAAQADPAPLRVLRAERAYAPDRATDLFALLERGARIATTSELFDALDQAGAPDTPDT